MYLMHVSTFPYCTYLHVCTWIVIRLFCFREGMIIVHNSGLTGDPTIAKVEIDRRMLDFCVGLDTEFSEIVEGSHLYYPKTRFEQVSTTAV